MANESLRVSEVIPAKPEEIYFAWLDSDAHSAMTGGAAEIADGVGARFTAWDGYIEGTTLHLEPGRRIVQAWRTTEFPEGSPDSRLEIILEAVGDDGTTVTIVHSEIPDGQGHSYEQGWHDNYFLPMKKYFSKSLGASDEQKASPKPATPKKAKATRKATTKRAAAKKKPSRSKKSPSSKAKSSKRSRR